MRRILRKLLHGQLLASVAVIVVASVTFAFLALLGGNQQDHIETDALIDSVQARVVQMGMIHSAIANANDVSMADIVVVTQTRQQINDDLVQLKPRLGDNATYRDLERDFNAYAEALDTLLVAAQSGTLPAGESAVKGQAATSLVRMAASIRETRAQLTAESNNSWRVTQIGFGGAVVFLAASVLVVTLLTERRLRRALLDKERTRLAHERTQQVAALLENISDTIVVLDIEGRIRYASPAIEQILGRTASSTIGTPIVDLLHPDDFTGNTQALRDIVAAGAGTRAVTAVVRVRRGDNQWAWVEASATNRLDVPGIDGIVINARDVTERRLVEEQLRFHALHDSLTGLANRTVFTQHVGKALQRSRRAGSSFAVMYVDLDNFKQINDTWGHAVGDEVLVEFAARLRTILRDADTAARQGGDEFVLLIEDISGIADAQRVAERVHAALSRPFAIGSYEYRATTSIGIVVSDGTGDATVDDVLRHADSAMYTAKHAGRNRTAVHDPNVTANQNTTLRLLAASD